MNLNQRGIILVKLIELIIIFTALIFLSTYFVLEMILKEKKEDVVDGAWDLISAAEDAYFLRGMVDKIYIDVTYVFHEDGSQSVYPCDVEPLEFKKYKPSKGTLTVYSDGEVSLSITDGIWSVEKYSKQLVNQN